MPAFPVSGKAGRMFIARRFDLVLQGMGGLMHLTGAEGGGASPRR